MTMTIQNRGRKTRKRRLDAGIRKKKMEKKHVKGEKETEKEKKKEEETHAKIVLKKNLFLFQRPQYCSRHTYSMFLSTPHTFGRHCLCHPQPSIMSSQPNKPSRAVRRASVVMSVCQSCWDCGGDRGFTQFSFCEISPLPFIACVDVKSCPSHLVLVLM